MVANWAFYQQRGIGWSFIPAPDLNGRIHLQPDDHNWVTWSGQSRDPVTLDLGVTGVKLEKMEFTSESKICIIVSDMIVT